MIRLEIRTDVDDNERELKALRLVNRHECQAVSRHVRHDLLIHVDQALPEGNEHVPNGGFYAPSVVMSGRSLDHLASIRRERSGLPDRASDRFEVNLALGIVA